MASAGERKLCMKLFDRGRQWRQSWRLWSIGLFGHNKMNIVIG